MIYCFQSLANFPLALSFGHETVAKAFLVGTSGPKEQVEFWQNTIWEFSIFARWAREAPYVFIFPLLWTCAFTDCSRSRCATNRVRGVAGILFRMASRQTATITLALALATSCSICAIALSPRSNRNESQVSEVIISCNNLLWFRQIFNFLCGFPVWPLLPTLCIHDHRTRSILLTISWGWLLSKLHYPLKEKLFFDFAVLHHTAPLTVCLLLAIKVYFMQFRDKHE